METITLKVNGMSCEHCVKAIEGSVEELAGIKQVEVNLNEGTVAIQYDPTLTSLDSIKETIDDQGYEVA